MFSEKLSMFYNNKYFIIPRHYTVYKGYILIN